MLSDRCLWVDATSPPPPPARPAASLPQRTDVAIVGAGYTGLAAARALARRGVDATVLEQHTCGWGASGRNGGLVLPGYQPDIEKLAGRLGAERAAHLFRLSLEAVGELSKVIAEEGISCDFTRCGAVTLAAKPEHMRALERTRRFLDERLGYEVELLGREELSREVASPRYHGGLLDPGGCSLHPARYAWGLAQAAERAGARLLEGTEVTRVRRIPGAFEVTTSRGSMKAREVLAATNAYTPRALTPFRRRIVPIGSHLIATAPLGEEQARRLMPRNRVFSDTKALLYYFRLSPDGRMVFGGRVGFTPVGARRCAAMLAAGLAEVFPELAGATIEYAWSGKVAFPMDHLPHAGRLHGIHYSMGYSGHGVALATYLGGQIGEVLAGAGTLPDLGTSRFPAIPLYHGVPWFLPLVGGYYRLRDRFG